jgi:hypothetical protein
MSRRNAKELLLLDEDPGPHMTALQLEWAAREIERLREENVTTARVRAHEVRANLDPPAWASKGGEPESWRRAALILARDLLILTREKS